MCIAIVKPKGVNLPSKQTLKTCWDNNPDGAGFCYNDGHNVIIHKGYMDFKSFYNAFKICARNNNFVNKDVAIHFRISTGGGVTPQNTHPFMISTRMNDLQRTYAKCKDAFIHNGVISGYGTKDFSDTMEYVTEIIANIKDIDHSNALINKLANEKHSRFAVVTRKGFMLGGSWVKDAGIYYSNTTYKPYEYKSSKYWNNKVWDYADTCDWCGKPFKHSELKFFYDRDTREYAYICKDCDAIYDEYLKSITDAKLVDDDKQLTLLK